MPLNGPTPTQVEQYLQGSELQMAAAWWRFEAHPEAEHDFAASVFVRHPETELIAIYAMVDYDTYIPLCLALRVQGETVSPVDHRIERFPNIVWTGRGDEDVERLVGAVRLIANTLTEAGYIPRPVHPQERRTD